MADSREFPGFPEREFPVALRPVTACGKLGSLGGYRQASCGARRPAAGTLYKM